MKLAGSSTFAKLSSSTHSICATTHFRTSPRNDSPPTWSLKLYSCRPQHPSCCQRPLSLALLGWGANHETLDCREREEGNAKHASPLHALCRGALEVFVEHLVDEEDAKEGGGCREKPLDQLVQRADDGVDAVAPVAVRQEAPDQRPVINLLWRQVDVRVQDIRVGLSFFQPLAPLLLHRESASAAVTVWNLIHEKRDKGETDKSSSTMVTTVVLSLPMRAAPFSTPSSMTVNSRTGSQNSVSTSCTTAG
eukprot:1716889-Rhodomonas_salina.1